MERTKPLIIYLHRYPPEYESEQFPVMRDLFDALLPDYQIMYFCMKGAIKIDDSIRRGLIMKEIPLTINRTDSRDKWIKTILYYFYIPKIIWKIKSQKPSFIICKETLPFIPAIVGKLGIPSFTEASDWWWSIVFGKKNIGKQIAQFLEKFEVQKWNQNNLTVIAHTRTEAKIIEEKGLSKEKIKIINAPLYGNVYCPYNAAQERQKLGFNRKIWVVAVHGIIHQSKGYGQILAWWKKLIQIHPNWMLMIIGGSGGEEWCRNEIKQLGLKDNTVMTGWLPTQHDVNRYLNAADCLLVTRRNTIDNHGVIPSSLYHSLPTGKPTIATKLGGMSEIIEHGVSGYLYEPDSYESFKEVLEYVASHPKEAEKVGKRGIKRAEECFNPKRAITLYKEIIDQFLKPKQIAKDLS